MTLKSFISYAPNFIDNENFVTIKDPKVIEYQIYYEFAKIYNANNPTVFSDLQKTFLNDDTNQPIEKSEFDKTTIDAIKMAYEKNMPIEQKVMIKEWIAWAIERRGNDEEYGIQKHKESKEINLAKIELWSFRLKFILNLFNFLFNHLGSSLRRSGYKYKEFKIDDIQRIDKLNIKHAQSFAKPLTNSNKKHVLYQVKIGLFLDGEAATAMRPIVIFNLRTRRRYQKYKLGFKKIIKNLIESYNFKAIEEGILHSINIPTYDIDALKKYLLETLSGEVFSLDINNLDSTISRRIPDSNLLRVVITAHTRENDRMYRFTYTKEDSPNNNRNFDVVINSLPDNSWSQQLCTEAAKFVDTDISMIKRLQRITRNNAISVNSFNATQIGSEQPGSFTCKTLNLYQYTFSTNYYGDLDMVCCRDIDIIKTNLYHAVNNAKFSFFSTMTLEHILIPESTGLVKSIETCFFDIPHKTIEIDSKSKRFSSDYPDDYKTFSPDEDDLNDTYNEVRKFKRAADLAADPTTLSEGILSYLKSGRTVDSLGKISILQNSN